MLTLQLTVLLTALLTLVLTVALTPVLTHGADVGADIRAAGEYGGGLHWPYKQLVPDPKDNATIHLYFSGTVLPAVLPTSVC